MLNDAGDVSLSRVSPSSVGGLGARLVYLAAVLTAGLALGTAYLQWPDAATLALAFAVWLLAGLLVWQTRSATRRWALLQALQAVPDVQAAPAPRVPGGAQASKRAGLVAAPAAPAAGPAQPAFVAMPAAGNGVAATQTDAQPTHAAPRASPFSLGLTAPAAAVDLATQMPRQGNSRLRVLVAEDHDINRQLLAGLLASLGHEAHFAANGALAFDAARQTRFDVVLMDLAMPELDGIAATQAIRALPDNHLATVPIVALTADQMPQTRARCLLVGMNDFLGKPVGADALVACLRRLFGDEAAAAQWHADRGGFSAMGWVAAPAVAANGSDNVAASAGASSSVNNGGSGSGSSARTPIWGASPALVDHAILNEVLSTLPREQVTGLIQRFFAEAPASLQRLREAVRSAHTQDLSVAAHAIRGVALNLGLPAVAGTTGALFDGANLLAAHEVALLLQRLELQLLQTHQALQAMGLAVGADGQDAPA